MVSGASHGNTTFARFLDHECTPGERLFVGRVLSIIMYSLWLSARMSVVFVAPTLQQFLHRRDPDVFLYKDEAEAADEATLPDAR